MTLPRPLVIAHRGASSTEVENSLAAFRAAAPAGADGVELDVHASTDGVLFVHHDDRVNGARITRSTAEQIAALRLPNGEPVPTLDQALDAIDPRLQVFVEVKSLPPRFDDRLYAALVDTIQSAGYKIFAWTVNDLDEMKQLTELGVDGLCSNFPSVARTVVDAAK